jgi:hypothetical protein
MHTLTKIPLAALVLSTGACAFDGDGVGGESLESRLATRAFLDLASSSEVGVTATNADGRRLDYVEPRVTGGRAVLRTTETGYLLVEDLEIQLADVVIPPGELGPDSVVLTDVGLQLGTQIDAQVFWASDGEAAWGAGDADLLLDWSLVLDSGDTWPLATQRLGEADFEVAVMLDADGGLTAQVDTSIRGQVHELTGLVTLSDLNVAVDAIEPI